MGILGWIILGVVAGAIAKALHRGHEPGGLLGTFVVGVAGALLGGFIASIVGIGGVARLPMRPGPRWWSSGRGVGAPCAPPCSAPCRVTARQGSTPVVVCP